MDNISINNNTNSNNVRHEIATNNDARANKVDANQQNIVVVENANDLPANQQNIGDRPLEQREIMQQEQIPVVDVDALVQQYKDYITYVGTLNGNHEIFIMCRAVSDEKAQEILEAFKDAKSINLAICNCPNITRLKFQNFKDLKHLYIEDLINLIAFDIKNSPNVENLNIQCCQKLKHLAVTDCPKLHGELDVSGAQQLDYVYIANCADDFVVVISSECPFAQNLPANHPHIRIKRQPSIEKQRTSFLNKEEDKGVAQMVIDLVRNHNKASNDQKKDFENCLKNYCERYVNASEGEKARAAEKYMSALTEFRTYMNTCKDAFAAGLAKLKIKLELGNLLKSCNTAEERRQVLFGVYAQEQIERSIGRFDELYTGPNGHKVGELVELQLALNIVFNVPYSEKMAYSNSAAEAAKAVTDAYNANANNNANANKLRDLIVPGETFLKTHNEIKSMFLARARTKLRLNKDKAQSFEGPLRIVLTSMLRDDAANENLVDRKFNTFLLKEQEYWPLAAEVHEQVPNAHALTVGGLEEKIGETNDTIAIKDFIQKHKGQLIDPSDNKKMSDDDPDSNEMHTPPDKKLRVGESVDKSTSVDVIIPSTADQKKLSENSTLFQVFDFLSCNGMESDPIYEIIANMTTKSVLLDQQQQSIGNLYCNDVYEAKLAEHLQNALRSNEQQQVNVNQPENNEQIAERMQLEEYMNPLGNDA